MTRRRAGHHPQSRGLHGRRRLGSGGGLATRGLSPGTVTLFAGPNGSGKSTTLGASMGLLAPDDGSVPDRLNAVPSARPTPSPSRTDRLAAAAAGDRALTMSATIQLFGALDAEARPPSVRPRRAASTAWCRSCPRELDTRLGAGGVGLSAGRVSVSPDPGARLRLVPLLLLDGPTARLDAASERAVLEALRERARAGDTGHSSSPAATSRVAFAESQIVDFGGGVPCVTTR